LLIETAAALGTDRIGADRALQLMNRLAMVQDAPNGIYGGEEFVIALPRMSPAQALQRVENWRLELSETSVTWHDGECMISVNLSAGIAGFPDHGADVEILLLRADAALYRSKNEGRNRVTCSDAAN